ncbi:hypothetical protein Tco_0196582 [Tanacetum coccineum]
MKKSYTIYKEAMGLGCVSSMRGLRNALQANDLVHPNLLCVSSTLIITLDSFRLLKLYGIAIMALSSSGGGV